MTLIEGDFSFVADDTTRTMYEDMYAAITKSEAWAWIVQDPGEGGFMFNDSEKSRLIGSNLVDRVGHSGASYGFTLRAMQHLATVGWAAFVATSSL